MAEPINIKAIKKVAKRWGDPQSEPPGTQWVGVPGVAENINRRATGNPKIDWINHSGSLLARFKKPIKALSLGCGFGAIERILRRRNYCQFIHGVDVAEKAIESARRQAAAEGLDGVTYEVADLNTVTFPEDTYDVVYAHACLHHVFHLEHLLDQIKRTLRTHGLLVVQEYIGPSQMQFPQKHLQLADIFLKAIPERYRRLRTRPGTKQEAPRLPLDTMNDCDPSEAIRATEIVPLIASRFEVKHFCSLAGSLLLLIFNEIAGNFDADDDAIMPLVTALIALDNFLVDNEVLPSYHVYMVCEKTGNLMPMQTRDVLSAAASVLGVTELETRVVRPQPSGSITSNPNPFNSDSRGIGQTTLSWMSYGTSKVEVHLGATDGPLFARTGPGGFSQATGQWVRNGTTFYLQNVSDGLPLAVENTLATVTLQSV
jgi:2-polyprenyl-3-methyl-5-hydroxy-6-metoxy-1,4-benzoquinol methylase